MIGQVQFEAAEDPRAGDDANFFFQDGFADCDDLATDKS
jgi:hypothetical protein